MPKHRTVLIAFTSAHSGWFKGVARYAREHNWHLAIDMMYNGEIPVGWQGDGIISFIGNRRDLEHFILSSGMPTVDLSATRSELGLPSVQEDNEMIGRLAAEHFLERGYRNYVWAPIQDNQIDEDRYQGFANRLAKEGLTSHVLPPAKSRDEEGDTSNWATRRKLLVEELRRLPKPLAAFGFNDRVAADLIEACNTAGLLVPEEVAVLGVDNDVLLCECLKIPLSSVCHDLEGMAYKSAGLLDCLMSRRPFPKKIPHATPTGVATRRSSDMMAVNNLQVARALRFIHDCYANPLLSVDDIVAATGVSRRPLEKAFRHELRRTVNEEVLRVRMEQVKQLLDSTKLSVSEISKLAGFTRPNHLFRIFRKQLGMNPKQFRARQLKKPTRSKRASRGRSRLSAKQ